MPREIINLDNNIQPLENWFSQPTTTILIVTGSEQGAVEARKQIKRMLEGNEDDYVNIAFGSATLAVTLKDFFKSKGITGFENFALISISPDPKKLISKVMDTDLIGKPGWIQQAILEAEGA